MNIKKKTIETTLVVEPPFWKINEHKKIIEFTTYSRKFPHWISSAFDLMIWYNMPSWRKTPTLYTNYGSND